MSLFEDTNPRALKDLLAEIHNRTTVAARLPARLRLGAGRDAGADRLDREQLPGGKHPARARRQAGLRRARVRRCAGARRREAHLPRARWPAAADLALSGLLRRRRAPLLPRPRQAHRWRGLRGGDLPRARHHQVGEGPRGLRAPGEGAAAAALGAEGWCRRLRPVDAARSHADAGGQGAHRARGRARRHRGEVDSRPSTTTTSRW